MIKFLNLFLLFLFFVLSFSFCSSKNSTNSEDDNFPENPDAFEQNIRIARSINLGNALEAPNEGDWGVLLRQEYFKIIADAGFDAVRVPIRWSTHAATDSPFTIEASFFNRIDWVIVNARKNKLAVIINIHHYEEIMENPQAHKNRYLGLWEQISEHYKDESLDVFFEVLNEPNNNLTAQLWNDYLVEGLKVIRETNPQRTVLIGTADWGGLGSLNKLIVPTDDEYIIVTYHYYSPFQFTHQGAGWVSGSDAWLGTIGRVLPQRKKQLSMISNPPEPGEKVTIDPSIWESSVLSAKLI